MRLDLHDPIKIKEKSRVQCDRDSFRFSHKYASLI